MLFVLLRRRCAYCGCQMGYSNARGYEAEKMQETHGICQSCFRKEMAKLENDLSEIGVMTPEKEVGDENSVDLSARKNQGGK